MEKIMCELIIKQIEEKVKTLRILVCKSNDVYVEELLDNYESLLIESYVLLEKIIYD